MAFHPRDHQIALRSGERHPDRNARVQGWHAHPGTAEKAFDYLNFAHAVDVYTNAFQGASLQGFREGMLKVGVEDNQVIIWPRLMDSETLLLTPNADTTSASSILRRGRW
jgi:hypothetical protein